MAMVEPLPYARDADGALELLGHRRAEQGGRRRVRLGRTSRTPGSSSGTRGRVGAGRDHAAHPAARWRAGPDPAADLAAWGAALRHPVVRGLVVGRSLLYPPDGDVAGAVRAAAGCSRRRRAAVSWSTAEPRPTARTPLC